MRAVLFGVLLTLLAACESSNPRSSKPLPAVRQPAPDIQQQVSAQEAASQPGPMHKKLDPLLGDWQTQVTRLGPDGNEVPGGGGGVTRITQLFGGRYQRWDAVLDIGGQSRETTGWLGYDRGKQEYQLSMITSFSSGMCIYRGHGDLAKDGIVFLLDDIDPKTGVPIRARNRLKLVSADHFVIEDVDQDMIAYSRSHYRRVKN